MSAYEDDSIPMVSFIQETPEAEVGPIISDFKRMEIEGKLNPEPLLAEDKTRFVLFPIKHTDVSCCVCTSFFN